jgi:ribosome-binding factor A
MEVHMPGNRIERTNEDIQRVLSTLLRSVKDPRVQRSMLSVTGVETSSDLSYCQVYVSALDMENEKELMKGLKSAAGYLRHELGQSLSLRNTPALQFHLDRSIQQGAHISSILNKLDIREEETDDDE